MILNVIIFSCPLILAAIGALFSEYGGTLALYLESTISLSGFLFYLFTVLTHSAAAGFLLTSICVTLITIVFAAGIHKAKAEKFIAALGMNILYNSVISLLSSLIFKTRGLLISPLFSFSSKTVQIITITITSLLIIFTILFLRKTQTGLYIRITGTNSELLNAKGLNSEFFSILSWGIAAFFGSVSGILLAMKISSFVPGLSGGKGWMALAAVFLGKKKWWQIILYIMIFCAIDYLSSGLLSSIKEIPSSVIISLPYLVILLLISVKKFV